MIKCTCGKDFKNGRALAAHKRFHCKKSAAEPLCDCEDGGDWAVLTRDVPGGAEQLAKINPKTGKRYRKYCTQCMEVV